VADLLTGGMVSVLVELAVGFETVVGELQPASNMLQITTWRMVLPITIGKKALGFLIMKNYHSTQNPNIELVINSVKQLLLTGVTQSKC
jgi:hypothetical protein